MPSKSPEDTERDLRERRERIERLGQQLADAIKLDGEAPEANPKGGKKLDLN